MKHKLFMLALVGTLAFQQDAMTQTTTDTNAASPAVQPATPAATDNATVTTTNDTTAVAVTNVPAAVPAAAVAPAVVPVTPVAATTAADTNATTAAAPAGTNGVMVVNAIPLIEFQDVPLTVAIENLARQAGINYLLDPKIGYGQPDQNGQIKTEPTLSIRWENVTAEQALLALLNNYDLQLTLDTRTRIGRISIKDPAAPLPLVTRVIQLKYASTSNMVDSVRSALTDRRSHVFPDVRTSQLVVVATENEQDAVDQLVNELDKPTRQVLIETKLVEISSTPGTVKGINWSGTLAAQNISFGNGVMQPGPLSQSIKTLAGGGQQQIITPGGGTLGGTTATPTSSSGTATTLTTYPQSSTLPGGVSLNTLTGLTPAMGFLNADGVQAVLSFLNSSYNAQVVSTPRVVTLDNEAATISVTRQFPVINVQASVTGVASGGSEISYSNIGTTLQVTPRITANDYIWLKVIPDVSSFFATVTKVVAGVQYQADEFDTRHIETQVMIPDANTLVMGGLVQDNPTAQWYQVPLLGDIPGLGWAFKSENVQMDKDNLIIFITPTIVKDDDFQPTTTDFLASRPRQMKEPMNPNSAWDRPEPNWMNPAPVPGEFQYDPKQSSQ
ncbi:MAG TPA: secretin N-terminal domain-containing protein [Pseudomonadales bacterium]|nr:secretin N-terminal domain-containing protein [Pseudomonadales bacterium]